MENLLDKFIRNESRSKLWALLSLLAFFAVSATVVAVSYNIKKNATKDVVETIVKDTVYLSKEDTATARVLNEQTEMIRILMDSNTILQQKNQVQLQEVDRYITRLKECEAKATTGVAPPPVPPAAPIAVMIYRSNVPEQAVEKVINLVQQSGASSSGYTFNTAYTPKIDPKAVVKTPVTTSRLERMARLQPAQKYGGVKYADVKFANEASVITDALNKGGYLFGNWRDLFPAKTDVLSSKSDIEIWLSGLTVAVIVK